MALGGATACSCAGPQPDGLDSALTGKLGGIVALVLSENAGIEVDPQ